jgi:hypothetical protein
LIYDRHNLSIGPIPERVSPRSRWQNWIAERLFGDLRRESLDQMLIADEAHLPRILSSCATYYNRLRTQLTLHRYAL